MCWRSCRGRGLGTHQTCGKRAMPLDLSCALPCCSRVASTCNHCPPELLLGELHPTNGVCSALPAVRIIGDHVPVERAQRSSHWEQCQLAVGTGD